jgi:hypothetical protein
MTCSEASPLVEWGVANSNWMLQSSLFLRERGHLWLSLLLPLYHIIIATYLSSLCVQCVRKEMPNWLQMALSVPCATMRCGTVWVLRWRIAIAEGTAIPKTWAQRLGHCLAVVVGSIFVVIMWVLSNKMSELSAVEPLSPRKHLYCIWIILATVSWLNLVVLIMVGTPSIEKHDRVRVMPFLLCDDPWLTGWGFWYLCLC